MGKTQIGWCDYSINFWSWVCTKVSEGCKNCYAQALATRYGKDFAAEPVWRDNARAELRKIPAGSTVFVADMSDLFLERVPDDWIDAVFAEMNWRPDLTFLLLTKRIERAAALAPSLLWTANIYLGTSVENQKRTVRIDALRGIDEVRGRTFLSLEPLLEPITADFSGIAGVITGGESGPKRRAFDPRWVLDIDAQCRRDGTLHFFKQGSAFKPGQNRVIDGVTYDALPWRQAVS